MNKLGVGPDSFLEEMIRRLCAPSEESVSIALVGCRAMMKARRRQPAMGGGVCSAPLAEAGLGKENPPPKRVRYSKQEPEREGEAHALDSALDPRQALLKRIGLIWRRCYDMRKSGYKNYLPGGL